MLVTLPKVEELKFNDCKPAALWLAACFQMSRAHNATDAEYPLAQAVSYLRSVLPDNLHDVATLAQLSIWWTETVSPSFGLVGETNTSYARVWTFPYYDCSAEVCQGMDFEGDPDLSGIGITISYTLAAAFSTCYFFAVLFENLYLRGKETPTRTHDQTSTRPGGHLASFLESINTFLEAALIFAMAMLGAVIARYVLLRGQFGVSARQYEIVTAGYMAHFSVLVPLVLESISAGALRRTRLRLLLWALVLGLFLIVRIFVLVLERELLAVDMARLQPASPWTTGFYWWNYCQDIRYYDAVLRKSADAGMVLILVNCAWFVGAVLYHVRMLRCRPVLDRGLRVRALAWLGRSAMHLRLANAFVCLVVLWFFLGVFHVYRLDVLRRAGEANKDTAWTFGQVMALATWLPVVFDFVNIYLRGAEQGLTDKISLRFKVVSANAEQGGELRHRATIG